MAHDAVQAPAGQFRHSGRFGSSLGCVNIDFKYINLFKIERVTSFAMMSYIAQISIHEET